MDYMDIPDYMPIAPPPPEPPQDVSSDVEQSGDHDTVHDESVGSEVDVEA